MAGQLSREVHRTSEDRWHERKQGWLGFSKGRCSCRVAGRCSCRGADRKPVRFDGDIDADLELAVDQKATIDSQKLAPFQEKPAPHAPRCYCRRRHVANADARSPRTVERDVGGCAQAQHTHEMHMHMHVHVHVHVCKMCTYMCA